MPQCIHVIGRIPFTANCANVLIEASLVTSRVHPDRCSIIMSATNMLTIEHKGMVAADRHALGITDPAVRDIALLFRNSGRRDDCTVRQRDLGDQRYAVRIKESDDVLACLGLNDRICYDIHSRGCGNGVCNAVAVNIPANQHLRLFKPFRKLQVRLADDLVRQEDLTADQGSVGSVEIRVDPIVAVNNLITVVPAREILVPAGVVFGGFNVDGDAGDVGECKRIDANVFSNDNGF